MTQLLNGLLGGASNSIRRRKHDSDSARERQKLLVDNLVSLSVQTMERLITGEPHQLNTCSNMCQELEHALAVVEVWLTCPLPSPACNSQTPMLKKIVSQLDVEEGELDCVLCAK